MTETPAAPRQSADRLRQIIELQAALVSGKFDLNAFMNLAVERVHALTFAAGAVVELLDGNEMVYRAASGTVAPYIGLRVKAQDSLSGLCVEQGNIMLSNDTSSDPRVNADACRRVNAASMVVVPLFRNNECVGVLKIVSPETNAFNGEHIQTLELIAGLLGGALGQQLEIEDRKMIETDLRIQAQSDPLTGLPNRTLFNDRLTHAIARQSRSGQMFALMYLDIDHFKAINDTYGHTVGDSLLQAFSIRVRGVIRASDTLARLGGDEFTLIAEQLHTPQEAELIAKKIVGAMKEDFILDELNLNITTSIGIAICTGADTDATALIARADAALYATKKAGRNGFMFAKIAG